jgi:RND family efflux transporter MFP subunit
MRPQAADRMLLQQLRINSEFRADQPEPRRSWWLPGGALLLIGVAVGAALTLTRGERFEVEAVTAVAPWSETGSNPILQATGYVTAKHQATVSAQVSGTLTEVLVDEGDHVKKGQVLARLESTAQKAALAQSEAQLQAALALLVQSKAQLKQDYRDLVRNEDLASRHLVSMQALETARTLVETQVSQVQSQRRQVDLAEATVKGARVMLEYTTVRAPFSGVVIAQPAQEGEITSPMSPGSDPRGSGVATIVDMDSLEIEVEVNEAYINRVRPNQPAQAVPDAYPDWAIPAHVLATIPAADRTKATVKVRLAIDQKDPRILPDMGVRISFFYQGAKQRSAGALSEGNQSVPKGVLVPDSSVVQLGQSNVVFTIDGKRARAQRITLAETYGDLRLVEGIPSGIQVVKAPPAEMTDGARIAIKNQQ